MSYMWSEFNIKTFPAETIVFRDGVYCPELSTLEYAPINKKYELPVHIIYIGEITGKCRLDINVGVDNQKIVLSAKITNKTPAFLNIFIKNAGKNSEITGSVIMENYSELDYDCNARHLAENTTIAIKNKLLASKTSVSKLSGVAIIDKHCINCKSDIGFTAMAEQGAKIEFLPAQRISAEPIAADHSAAMYEPTEFQIQYLRQAGLGTFEVRDALKEAFTNE